jgi:hypothetical protein
MIYILHQRLVAQNIFQEKSDQVMTDVVLNYASSVNYWMTSFLTEVQESRKQISVTCLRNAFESVISASAIMKLTPPSFDKLYDLMLGTFKYQVIRCPFPSSMYYLTRNHVNNLMKMIDRLGSGVRNRIQTQIRDAFEAQFSQLTKYQWSILRQTLLTCILCDVQTRVSILIRQGMQDLKTGCYVIPVTDSPGVRITNYNDDGEVIEESGIYLNSLIEMTTLGENIYLSELPETTEHENSLKEKSKGTHIGNKTLSTTATEEQGRKETTLLFDLLGSKFLNPEPNNIALDFTFDSDYILTTNDNDYDANCPVKDGRDALSLGRDTVNSTRVQPIIDFNVDADDDTNGDDPKDTSRMTMSKTNEEEQSRSRKEQEGEDLLALMDS